MATGAAKRQLATSNQKCKRMYVTLCELAFECYVFSRGYDEAYAQLLEDTKPRLDLDSGKHRLALLKWLNKWGCRQFAKDQHSDASAEIKDWYEKFRDSLCPADATLLTLTTEELNGVERAYTGLLNRTASHKRKKNGEVRVTVGPAGTAKGSAFPDFFRFFVPREPRM
jgi:hypothetical protein